MSAVSNRKFPYFKLYINNLSKYWSLGADAIDIPSGSDMHTYLSPGNYRCQSATIAKTLTNCPFQSAFTMKVYYSIGSKPSATDYYILQEYTRLDGGERVLVYFEAKNNKWDSHAIAFKDDLPNIYGVKFDKNNEASDHVQTIKNVWNKFPDSQPFVCTLADANQCIIIGFVYSNRKYGAVLYLAFNSCGIVKCNGGTFSDTKL